MVKKKVEIKFKDIQWFLPTIYLSSAFILLISFEKTIDYYYGDTLSLSLKSFLSHDINILANTFGGLGEIAPAIIAIALTVIAIVVELVANKYSPKIVDLFIEDRKNNFIISFFVISALNQLFVANTLTEKSYFSLLVALIMIMTTIILIIPYFNYVFTFLHPTQFIKLVKERSIKTFDSINNNNYNDKKEEIHYFIDFIGDIAINSTEQSDRSTALECINSLNEIITKYYSYKNKLPIHWFILTDIEYKDPDFTDFSPFVLQNIEKDKIWLERKVFKLFELLFINSHNKQRDISSGILANLQFYAKSCIEVRYDAGISLSMKMLNTLLRISINTHSPRSAFNILEHYRVIGEYMILKYSKNILELAKYIKYYAQESNKLGVYFIMETAAHDLFVLNKLAYEKNIPYINKLLDIFLSLDEPVENEAERAEYGLIGVRIAQTKLATFYLYNNRPDLADLIYKDMKSEPLERIEKIKLIILSNQEEEYYEFTGRGINFFFIEDEYKPFLMEFFTWFEFNYD
ncbi:MAG TPA: DUF2254 family protein [Ignavibacteriales bacterium]|nr:DUF2254 family protein [Ignavibacteriales bacterium]